MIIIHPFRTGFPEIPIDYEYLRDYRLSRLYQPYAVGVRFADADIRYNRTLL